jgi:N12 class adenine-specific DNA methylase
MYTKMRNVAGLSTSEAQKSSDLFMKCRYMDELTDNKGVIFATGTPVSNSIAEMYTMQRYLQNDRLVSLNMNHFDAWASTFGETVTSIELAPEGVDCQGGLSQTLLKTLAVGRLRHRRTAPNTA